MDVGARNLLETQRTRGVTVDIGESKIHSFIVKVWLEDNEEDPDVTLLHGHITHVPSGERHYIREVSEVPLLIRSYLERTGIALESDQKVPLWMTAAGEFARKSFRRWAAMTRMPVRDETRGRRPQLLETERVEDRDGDVLGGAPSGGEVRHKA